MILQVCIKYWPNLWRHRFLCMKLLYEQINIRDKIVIEKQKKRENTEVK